jgi:alpha-amylase
MPSIALYLKTHQPFRVKRYRFFDIGQDHNYFNDDHPTNKTNNDFIIRKVATKSYLPANKKLLSLLNKYSDFCFSISLSGVLLEQLERVSPETIVSFQKLVETGRVEVLGETYYHSLSFFYSKEEFERQVLMQEKILKRLFGISKPKVFSNTELAYRNDLGIWIEESGYKGIVTEGWDPILGWRSPNFVYRPKGTKEARLLLKNYKLSDDVAFRFSNKGWSEWPLTAEKYAQWVHSISGNGDTVNLFMDYETFGEHQWAETGIFDFLEAMPKEIYKHPDWSFKTLSQTIKSYPVRDEVDVPNILTWADTERDLTAWTGNEMQRSVLDILYSMENKIIETKEKKLLDDWRKLQTSDHVYYMCTKWFADGDVHTYFSPYESPYEAYMSVMNAIHDLQLRLDKVTTIK